MTGVGHTSLSSASIRSGSCARDGVFSLRSFHGEHCVAFEGSLAKGMI